MSIWSQVRLYRQLQQQMYRFSPEEIQSYQWNAIQQLLATATKKSSYYATMLQQFKVTDWSSFRLLPTLNKRIMMDHFDDINTAGLKKDDVMNYAVTKELAKDYLGYYQNQYVIGLSSGTSGNKGLYVTPKAMTKQIPALFIARGGVTLSDLPARILFMLRVFSQGFQDINAPFLHLHYLHTMTPAEEIVRKLITLKISIWMAPPSLLRMMLPYASQVPPLKKIITYAEVLTIEEKELFSKVFNTPILEIYQASEGQLGSPCRHGQLHINEDLVYVELYDENNQLVTQTGIVATRMIVTNLVNSVQPLIRYEMNDIIVLGNRCPCGSHFRVIDHIIGRNDDVLIMPTTTGKLVHIFPDLISRWIITTSDNIREYRVFHHSNSSNLLIELDLYHEDDPQIHERLIDRLTHEFGEYGVVLSLQINHIKIALSEGNLKFKRFIVTHS